MEHDYYKEYSQNLGKDMEFNVYGYAGQPILMFPTMNGRFYQYDDFALLDSISEYINQGKIQVFTADGIDFEGLTCYEMPGQERLLRHEQYVSYVTKELVPRILKINKSKLKPIVAGCSMGGYHTTNFFFRFPELFSAMISLSGVFSLRELFDGYFDDNLLVNSPLDYIQKITKKDKQYKQYIKKEIVMCCGQGAFEEKMMHDMGIMQHLLSEKQIPACIDVWGFDVNHDWDWWKKQLPYFLEKVLQNIKK